MQITNSIQQNIEMLKQTFSNDKTMVYREFNGTNANAYKFCLVFISNIVDKDIISDNIIKPIVKASLGTDIPAQYIADIIERSIINLGKVNKTLELDDIISGLLSGSAVLLIEGGYEALLMSAETFVERAVEEPQSEKAVKGPREGFNEILGTNLSLIRRRIKTPDLKLDFKQLGKVTKTNICVCYIENIASPKIVDEVMRRLDKIDIDGVVDSGYIQELIKDKLVTPFDTVGNTERVDSVVGKLLEGRVAIVCDGSPIVLTVPFIFMEYFQTAEDYYDNFLFASFSRIVRWIAFFMATSVPAVYVAIITFHQEMIPTPLLLSISAARQGVPLPTIVEALVMLFLFEILREAGARIPSVIGQAISIVGALIIGQAAVEARLISAPMIIVTALAGISGFLVPKAYGATIIVRFIFLMLASALGLYGYLFGIMGLFLHLDSLRTVGIPYMLNTASFRVQAQKDMVVRLPWQLMNLRPKLIVQRNRQRKRENNENKGRQENE